MHTRKGQRGKSNVEDPTQAEQQSEENDPSLVEIMLELKSQRSAILGRLDGITIQSTGKRDYPSLNNERSSNGNSPDT